MELKVITDLSVIPQQIDFNFEEIRAALAEKLDYYNNLVVTENSIREAKSDRAKLNKLKTAVEGKRKEIKKICLEPYTSFEIRCRELSSMISEPILSIDSQIKKFENQNNQKKLDELKKHFEVICTDSMIKFEDVLPAKWENKTESAESLKNQINEAYDRYTADIASVADISGGKNERYSVLLAVYLRNKSMNEVIAENSRLNQIAEKITVNNANEETPSAAVTRKSEIADNEPILEASFRVRGTKSQIIALRNFMTDNGIEFMPV